jgi:hypothetical protein
MIMDSIEDRNNRAFGYLRNRANNQRELLKVRRNLKIRKWIDQIVTILAIVGIFAVILISLWIGGR